MVASGAVTGATMVWTAGQDGWKPARETALTRLFHAVPPPPPAG
jgi:GYF domain 2